ncbi:hypothetical protein Anapl_06197 [Anas platyrhynchos]|uniref:Uncharacterized protein n=1 Tax=Anas platyrhynchos TaxID=8839 RepID=R0LI95_ANAPL|nr:hypothetical protein Anapl_06197 [Anas platyrhynchos]
MKLTACSDAGREARVGRGRQKVINATCVNSLAVADPAGDVAERGGQLLSLLGLAPLLCGGRPRPEAVSSVSDLTSTKPSQRNMDKGAKPFPGTMSIAGNGCTKTAKELSVIAQYMKTWNSSKSLK